MPAVQHKYKTLISGAKKLWQIHYSQAVSFLTPAAQHMHVVLTSDISDGPKLFSSIALVAACRLYQCNVCGEGGEYESLVLDCPMFTHGRIVLDAWENIHQSADSFAPVGHLHPVAYHLESKILQGKTLEGKTTPNSTAPPRPARVATSPLLAGSSQEKLRSNRQLPLITALAASGESTQQSSSKALELLAVSETDLRQQTSDELWAAATVIEVPRQVPRSVMAEAAGASAETDGQAAGAAAKQSMHSMPSRHSRQSVPAWSADVQLQRGHHYVRAVCWPARQGEGCSSSAATADALDCALAAIQQGWPTQLSDASLGSSICLEMKK